MRAFRRSARAAVVAAQALLLGGCFWLFLDRRAAPPAGRPALFEVGRGWSVRATARELKAKGIRRRAAPVLAVYTLFYRPLSLKAGEYEIPPGAGPAEILAMMTEGRILLHPVTIPEGLTARETGEALAAAGFGAAADYEAAFADTREIALWDPRAADLEGYLFPETYHLPKGTTPAEIAARMTAQFKAAFGEAGRARAAELGMSVREAVILASLIEEETGIADERPLVSAVFHNRLRLRMKLDCDPTIIYALKLRGAYRGRLLSKDLRLDSPYNTYLHPGLPPGPITNPGRSSLEAALHPAQAEALYFVLRENGRHQFSRTLREHQRAVAEYRRGLGASQENPRAVRKTRPK